MAFKLSSRSLGRLAGVHSDLVRVVERAIQITAIDFGVTEGLRTAVRQKTLVESGASSTMNSRHLTGHAVDLVAYLGREVSWDFGLYYQIAEAMGQAAQEKGVPLEWGACWSRIDTGCDLTGAVADYTERKRREGKKPLLDGPHFQLPWNVYP